MSFDFHSSVKVYEENIDIVVVFSFFLIILSSDKVRSYRTSNISFKKIFPFVDYKEQRICTRALWWQRKDDNLF
jgi:hypothetical protein